MTKSYAGPEQFVGVDLARRRSVITRMDADGGVVDCVQIDNSGKDLLAHRRACVISRAGSFAAERWNRR